MESVCQICSVVSSTTAPNKQVFLPFVPIFFLVSTMIRYSILHRMINKIIIFATSSPIIIPTRSDRTIGFVSIVLVSV